MTAKSRKLRLPRKTVFIIGGVLLLGGATGAFALYLTKDHFLGGDDDKKSVASLACTTVKTFKIKKKDRYWIRKFIKTEPADGLVRVATALRVAEAVYTTDKPDLVQVVVLDQRGPEQRADMRGRAIGADVVYVPHPENIPDLADTPIYSAKYIDGQANDAGQFYGEKIQLPPEHIDSLVSMLTDHIDCIDPAAPEAKAKDEKKGGEEKAAEGEAKAPEGEEKAAPEGEAEKPVAEKPAEGSETETPVAEAPAEAPAEKQAAAAAEEPEKREAAAPAEAPVTHEASAPAETSVEQQAAAPEVTPETVDEPVRADVPAVSDEQTSAPGPRAAGNEAGKAAETPAEPVAASEKPEIVESVPKAKPPVTEKAEPAKSDGSDKPKAHAAKPEKAKPEKAKVEKAEPVKAEPAKAKPEQAKAEHGKPAKKDAKASAKAEPAKAEQVKAEPEEDFSAQQDFYDEPSVSGSE